MNLDLLKEIFTIFSIGKRVRYNKKYKKELSSIMECLFLPESLNYSERIEFSVKSFEDSKDFILGFIKYFIESITGIDEMLVNEYYLSRTFKNIKREICNKNLKLTVFNPGFITNLAELDEYMSEDSLEEIFENTMNEYWVNIKYRQNYWDIIKTNFLKNRDDIRLFIEIKDRYDFKIITVNREELLWVRKKIYNSINGTIKQKIILLLRYMSNYDIGHNQLAVKYPYPHAIELFASPLNNEYDKFCSIFPLIDNPFGSLGSVFDYIKIMKSGIYVANPPFINAVMERFAKELVERMSEEKGITCYIYIPIRDYEGYISAIKHFKKKRNKRWIKLEKQMKEYEGTEYTTFEILKESNLIVSIEKKYEIKYTDKITGETFPAAPTYIITMKS